MTIYMLVNNRVPTKKWLDIAEEFRKYLSLPFDTKFVRADSEKAGEMVGLIEILNALSQAGYKFNHGFVLQKEEAPVQDLDLED